MSRSGTTLLTTILDSHPSISMGYELLPVGLGSAQRCIDVLTAVVEEAGDDVAAVAAMLRDRGDTDLRTFVNRCDRSGVAPREVIDVLAPLTGLELDTFEGRVGVSIAVVDHKRRREGTSICGFKLNAPSIAAFDALAPGSRYLEIVRDPRDVYASHLERGFDRTLAAVMRAWENYRSQFERFAAANPDRTARIRYEDLVSDPAAVLTEALARVGISFDPAVLHFERSKATVHRSGHANSEQLSRGFFTDSVARWTASLTVDQRKAIERAVPEGMRDLGYMTEGLAEVSTARRAKMRATFGAKKRFFRDQHLALLTPWLQHRNVTWREAATGDGTAGADILVLRHDIDHDLETALKIGRWEHEHGLRSTFCVLHTAWYYGELRDGVQQHTSFMVDACLELQSLGHEINFHNNVVALALRSGLDPVQYLRDELSFLRGEGIEIRGTSTHGDALCRQLDFRNYELFAESVYESRGGRRIVRHEGRSVELGALPMASLGLEYEAYDLPRDTYFTDSGGSYRVRRNTRGRGGARRDALPPLPWGEIVAFLTHPVWWDFTTDAPKGARLPVPADDASEAPVPMSSAPKTIGRVRAVARSLFSRPSPEQRADPES